MWVSSPSTYFSKHAYTYCGQWFVNLVFACIFCILNLPIAQAITPILEEDFQSGQVNSHPLAGNNNTSILFIRDSGPGRSLLVAGSVDYTQPLGLFGQSNNRGLHFYAGSDSQDDSPSLFLQSSHLAEFIGSVGLSYQLTHPSPSNTPALKIIIGEDLSGNQALASGNNDEALAQIDVRADGHLQIRTFNGIFQSDQQFNTNDLHEIKIHFNQSQTSFWVQVDDRTLTSGGTSVWSTQTDAVSAGVNAMTIILQGSQAGTVEAQLDDIWMRSGETATYYLDCDDPQASDAGPGTISQPWLSFQNGYRKLEAGDDLVVLDGECFDADGVYNSISHQEARSLAGRSTIRAYYDELLGQYDNVLLSSMASPTAADWQLLPNTTNVYRLDTANAASVPHNGCPRNVSHGNLPLRLALNVTAACSTSEVAADPTTLDYWQWTRNFDNASFLSSDPADTERAIYLKLPEGLDPATAGIKVSTNYAVLSINETSGEPNDFYRIKNIRFEGGYYGVYTESDHTQLINGEVFNTFADAIKGGPHANHALIKDVDVYHFGESGLDNTGGIFWTIENNHFHHAIANRSFGSKNNGLMLKRGGVGTVARFNLFSDMPVRFGAISSGGIGFPDNICDDNRVGSNFFENEFPDDPNFPGGPGTLGNDCLVEAWYQWIEGNQVDGLIGSGPIGGQANTYIFSIHGARHSVIKDNTIKNSSADFAVQIHPRESVASAILTASSHMSIENNDFYENNLFTKNYSEGLQGNTEDAVITGNIFSGDKLSKMSTGDINDDPAALVDRDYEQMIALGYIDIFPDIDIDGDTIRDTYDNCQMISNTDQINTDLDSEGDACDDDDDNDQMPDIWELQYSLNPLDASDAALDTDGDGVNNLTEYMNSSDPTVDESQFTVVIAHPLAYALLAASLLLSFSFTRKVQHNKRQHTKQMQIKAPGNRGFKGTEVLGSIVFVIDKLCF